MAVIAIGVTDGSMRSVLGTLASLKTGLDPALQTVSATELLAVAEQFRDQIKLEFKAGTDKHGESHDKGGPTLESFHVEPQPTGAFIVGEHGAAYVQEGSPPHVINGRPGGVLAFEGSDGAMIFTRTVHHPGYRGDDYVGRAWACLDLEGFAVRVATAAYASILLKSVGA